MTATNSTNKRELLTKKPFFRINPQGEVKIQQQITDIGERPPIIDKLVYDIVTQADFMRELDPNAHAINDKEIYQNWVQHEENGLYYETEWERHAFAYQQEILEDRLVRLTGNDIQFDLADKTESEENRKSYYKFKSLWASKSMERAWYEVAKSTLATGDAAFVGILDKGNFYWKVFTYMNGDELFPHYNRITGKLGVFARKYTDFGDDGESHNYIDVWDDKFYYRLVQDTPSTQEAQKTTDEEENEDGFVIGDFKASGYKKEYQKEHGFNRIPIAYMRKDSGPCWSNSQDSIEKFELAFSRLAQSNSAFGLPILTLVKGNGRKIEELSMGDMSYAAKIFLLPSEGKAEFLQRQDASNAYKSQLDELKRKIYEMSMVVKSPELKSGDTPAAAIKLLYSDSYNKGMNESQEFDECIDDIVYIFRWGAGIENKTRLEFMNLQLYHWIQIFVPISEGEMTTILATGVQNKFCSKQTASEKFPYATPSEWDRIKQEEQEENQEELLLQEQKLDIQNDAQVELQEELSDIQIEQQVEVAKAQATATSIPSSKKATASKAVIKKGSGSSGSGRRGRPNMSGAQWDDNRNKIDPVTGKPYSHWDGDGKS